MFRIQHTQKDYSFVGSRFAAGDLAGYTKVFTGSLISSLSPACQLLLLQQGHSIALCGSSSPFAHSKELSADQRDLRA